MPVLQNTLYVTTDGVRLFKDGEAVAVKLDDKVLLRVPLINLEGIVTFGWDIYCSPELMAACAERAVAISFHNAHGAFQAAVHAYPAGNVLLRRTQHRTADDPARSLAIARRCVQAKIANQRTLLRRAAREHADSGAAERLTRVANVLDNRLRATDLAADTASLRGYEGEAAAAYFENFNDLITHPDPALRLRGRSRRPPLDPVNAVLSFLYTMLAHDCRAACASAGLDPQIGFYHADRPGRAALALDLMEELRPVLADRVTLTLFNRRQLDARSFKTFENDAVLLADDARKTVLQAWQERKHEEIRHPVLDENIPLGLLPRIQAQLLARHLRGDHPAYLPYLWR